MRARGPRGEPGKGFKESQRRTRNERLRLSMSRIKEADKNIKTKTTKHNHKKNKTHIRNEAWHKLPIALSRAYYVNASARPPN